MKKAEPRYATVSGQTYQQQRGMGGYQQPGGYGGGVSLCLVSLLSSRTFYKVVAFLDLIVTTASFLGLYSCSCYWLLTISKVIIGQH